MIENLLQPAMVPFTVALGIMLAIALIEVVSLFFGAGLSQAVDSLLPDIDMPDVDLPDVDAPDVDIDAGGAGAGEGLGSAGALATVLAWFCIGRVPAVIILIAFLTAFGLMGVAVQTVAGNAAGAPLPVLVAVAATLVVALPLTRYLALAFAWIMPQEETEAVDSDGFIGQIAEVIRGTALPGQPAEAKLADQHGTVHYILVEPEASGPPLEAGGEALLIARQGAVFLAVKAETAALENHLTS